MRIIGYFDWELRPAVTSLVPGKVGGWAVLAPGRDWTKMSIDEIWDSGSPLVSEEEMRNVARAIGFGELPPLPLDLEKDIESGDVAGTIG